MSLDIKIELLTAIVLLLYSMYVAAQVGFVATTKQKLQFGMAIIFLAIDIVVILVTLIIRA